jgi:hypothetical protein
MQDEHEKGEEEFLKSSQPIEFAGCGRNQKYAWVAR